MERVAEKLTNYIVSKGAISKADYELYKYGFQTGMEMLVCVATGLLVAVQMGMFGEGVLFFLLFFSLRSYVGGIHMDSFKACYLLSCIVQIGVLLFGKYVPLTKNIAFIVSVCQMMFIYFINPVENDNRPVDYKQKIFFAKRIKCTLIGITLCTIVLYILDLNDYLNVIGSTLFMILISMILGEYRNRRRKME